MMIIASIEGLALAIIAWYSACGLNHMTRDTRPAVVFAVVVLFAGALGRIWLLFEGGRGDPSVAAILLAIAVGMVANRRRSYTCPCLPAFPARRNDKGANA